MRFSPLVSAMKLSLISGSVLMASTAFAVESDTDNTDTPTTQFEDLIVTVSADASSTGLMRAHAGGQVATGSRVGILGNKNTMDTPFSTTAYTAQFIENTQSDSVGDVLKKDPTVTVARGYGNFQDAYLMRGFVTYSDDTMYNGLYGILPRQYTSSELFERVEVQRGASALLNGTSPGGANTGGTITLLPKRAGNIPKRNVSVSYESDSQVKVATDLSSRFGEDNQFGIRFNAAYTKGDGAINHEEKEVGLVAIGADYRADKVRLSADIGYQDLTDTAKRSSVDVNNATTIPNAPDSDTNWTQPWAYAKAKDTFGTLRGEYDITDNLTAYAAYGFRKGEEENVLGGGFFYLTDGNTGDGYYNRFNNNREDTVNTGELGLKGHFATGKLTHDWTLMSNTYSSREKNATLWDFTQHATNLYNPTLSTNAPAFAASSWSQNDLNNPALANKVDLNSVAIADTVGMLDGDLQLTLGARYQQIEQADVTWATYYDDSKVTPMAAINYRIGSDWSAFANYSEKLTAGKQVQVNAVSQMFAPYVSKQAEAGVKYSRDGVGGSLSAFRITEPRAALVSNTAATVGDNVHQGLELSVFGSPADNWRIMSGFTLLDAKQKDTNDAFEGKRVIGAAKYRANAGLEYDVQALDGLTLTGDVMHTSSRYADAANTLNVDGYTLLNLGARYATAIGDVPVTLRGSIENVTDKKHWASVGGYPGQGYLVAGDPRTFKVSATFEF